MSHAAQLIFNFYSLACRHALYAGRYGQCSMKQRLSILILILVTSCSHTNYIDRYTATDNLIMDGKGMDSFELGKARAQDVIKELGKDFEEIKHKDYSGEIYYKDLGLSFYYFQNERTKQLFAIYFKAPFKGKTTKGIILNKATMEDVVQIYGPPVWTSCDMCDTWTVEYEGIEFDIERDKSLPHFPLDEERHLKKIVIGITVIEND